MSGYMQGIPTKLIVNSDATRIGAARERRGDVKSTGAAQGRMPRSVASSSSIARAARRQVPTVNAPFNTARLGVNPYVARAALAKEYVHSPPKTHPGTETMTPWKNTLVVVAVVIAALLAFTVGYWAHHSMRPARGFAVNTRDTAHSTVLIATQGSVFKDSIVGAVLAHLKPLAVYVKVVDVSALPQVHEADWDAIVVIHTWEMNKPQPDAQRFVSRVQDLRKVVVLSTSGKGTFKIDGVDAISSASKMIDVPKRVAEINARVDALLNQQSPRSAKQRKELVE